MSSLSALIVSSAFILMPFAAIAQGVVLGLQGPPTAFALVAGPPMVFGAYLVTVGGRERGLSICDALRCRLGAK